MKYILPACVLFLFFIKNILCQPTTDQKISHYNDNYYGGLQQELLYQQTLCCNKIETQKTYVENLQNNFTHIQKDTRDMIEQMVKNYTSEIVSLKKRIDTLEEISSNQSLQIKTLTDNTYGAHQDCASLFKSGYTTSGVYTINIPPIPRPVEVYCDMQHEGGGWTVFQRRFNGDVSFHQPWSAYKSGFGNITGEFWLGNDILTAMTAKAEYRLRIELTKFSNETGYAEYSNFRIGNESDNYRLTVGQYTGTAGDGGRGMSENNNLLFTTFDRDNDAHVNNCADPYLRGGGGWWYPYYCGYVSLNGVYVKRRTGKHISPYSDVIFWYPFDGFYSLLKTEMKFRPMNF